MATIMLCPLPEYGHINPTLKLARALKHAGHRVYYLGLADFGEYIQSQGLEFIPILETRYPKGASGEGAAEKKVGRLEFVMLEQREADAHASAIPFDGIKAELTRIIRNTHPDLLIADYLIGGLAYWVTQEFGLASAVLSVMLIDGGMLGKPEPEAGRAELPVLVLCPDALEFSHARDKPNRYHIEPSVDFQRQELHDFPWEALDGSKPLIYCSLGSESHLYKQSPGIFSAIIEAMRTKPDWQLVLAIGPYLKIDDLPPLPPNALVVNWAPQLQILQRAAMMITHGGLGSVKECIFLGVPMIVFPCRWDQPTNAARVVAHGLGVRGNVNHVSSHEVIAMIDNVSGNPSFKRSVETMSRTFREIEDSGRGVELIEQIIGSFKKNPRLYTSSHSRAELQPIQ